MSFLRVARKCRARKCRVTDLNLSSWLENRWCPIRAYITYACFCAGYYSYILQAIFHLFRVVSHKKQILQSLRIFLIVIIAQ